MRVDADLRPLVVEATAQGRPGRGLSVALEGHRPFGDPVGASVEQSALTPLRRLEARPAGQETRSPAAKLLPKCDHLVRLELRSS
jgi:hypothetical protein